MTFSPNVMHLLAEQTVTGAAANTVTFSNLDINSDRHYTLYFDIFNPTLVTVNYYLFEASDTTATDYWCQIWAFSNLATANSRENAPNFTTQVITHQYCSGHADIFLGIQGFLQYTSFSGRNFTNAGGTGGSVIVGARTSSALGNITGITIGSDTANAIGIGSRFRLYKTATV